ncbi:hypothetical protein Lche_2215 [Legionella cherrii]|uniref:Uncharacterized protein n=1 Tax=Legionella cherrii TaxID=28084 RepID=A0A0W0S9P7_9GAMM|nr:hypothetical protein Lche_2215 [Legionella cherrii]
MPLMRLLKQKVLRKRERQLSHSKRYKKTSPIILSIRRDEQDFIAINLRKSISACLSETNDFLVQLLVSILSGILLHRKIRLQRCLGRVILHGQKKMRVLLLPRHYGALALLVITTYGLYCLTKNYCLSSLIMMRPNLLLHCPQSLIPIMVIIVRLY